MIQRNLNPNNFYKDFSVINANLVSVSKLKIDKIRKNIKNN